MIPIFPVQSAMSIKHLNLQVALFTFFRWIIATNVRMVYPFLAVFARAMGVSINELSLAVSARNLIGAFSFLLAPISDRYGRKTGILVALGLPVAGNIMVIIWPGYLTFLIGMGLAYMGSVLFVSTVQAYLGDHIPYQQRGRVVGIIELGWALAFVLGMPLIGLIIERSGWVSPFIFLTVMGLVSFITVFKMLPVTTTRRDHVPIKVLLDFRHIFANPAARAGLILGFFFVMSQETINLVFGVWLEDSFGLRIAALGAASAVIGLADTGGELLTATLADRIGKRRSMQIGIIINSVVVFFLPFISGHIAGAFIGLFLLYLTSEFVINSSIPVMSEIMPDDRATLMGMGMATFALARAAGALLSPFLYAYGFQANTLAAFTFALAALVSLRFIKFSPGRHPSPDDPPNH